MLPKLFALTSVLAALAVAAPLAPGESYIGKFIPLYSGATPPAAPRIRRTTSITSFML